MCIFSLRICAAFHTGHGALLIQSASMQNEISQYTHRYRSVTGSGLRPDTRTDAPWAGLSAPGIRSQASCERLRELHVSVAFTVIAEACEATAVELVGVVVKRFADVCLLVRVQLVEFFQQGQRLVSDKASHVKGCFSCLVMVLMLLVFVRGMIR